jgi:thioredoxin-related protein
MKLAIKILIITLMFAFTYNAFAGDIEFQKGTFKEILAKAKAENKIVMIDFFTDWCKWCVELDNKVYSNDEVSGFANKHQVNWKIDAEKGEGVDLAKKYEVAGYPTIVFADANGKEIDRIVGYIPVQDFLKMMKDFNDGKNTVGALQKILSKNPDDPEANYKMAEKKINNENKPEDAKILLNKVLKSDPSNKTGYKDKAVYLLASMSGKTDELENFINNYPNSEKVKDAYISLAETVFQQTGDLVKAQVWYDKAFEKYGNNDEAITFSYAQIALQTIAMIIKLENPTDENLKYGLDLIDKCLPTVKGSINEGSFYYYQSEIYFRMKDIDKANTSIDKALAIHDKKVYRDQKEKINKPQQ